jgi:hypothetical protein
LPDCRKIWNYSSVNVSHYRSISMRSTILFLIALFHNEFWGFIKTKITRRHNRICNNCSILVDHSE